jgi:hypothetical protein
MPELFETHSDDTPQDVLDWAQRIGGRSEARIVLESLEPGQTVVYGSDEPAHTHRINDASKSLCALQEMVGRINRKTSTKRLKSQHNHEGKILITCFKRGEYHGN